MSSNRTHRLYGDGYDPTWYEQLADWWLSLPMWRGVGLAMLAGAAVICAALYLLALIPGEWRVLAMFSPIIVWVAAAVIVTVKEAVTNHD